MNRENIQKVRDHIAALDAANFNMRDWRDENGSCGFCACIGGWSEALLFEGEPYDHSAREVREALGLNYEQGEELFYPPKSAPLLAQNPWDATPAEAVRVLDHLLETGEVDWSIIDTPDLTAGEG